VQLFELRRQSEAAMALWIALIALEIQSAADGGALQSLLLFRF